MKFLPPFLLVLQHWRFKISSLKNQHLHSTAFSSARLGELHPFFQAQLSPSYQERGTELSLLFNMLSRFVTALLPRSKRLLTSCLQSPFAVILELRKIKSATVSIVSPSICHEVMGPDAMILLAF